MPVTNKIIKSKMHSTIQIRIKVTGKLFLIALMYLMKEEKNYTCMQVYCNTK